MRELKRPPVKACQQIYCETPTEPRNWVRKVTKYETLNKKQPVSNDNYLSLLTVTDNSQG